MKRPRAIVVLCAVLSGLILAPAAWAQEKESPKEPPPAAPKAGKSEERTPPPLPPAATGDAAPRDAAPRDAGGPGWLAGMVGIALLAGLGWYGVRALRERGVTLAGTLQSVGVELPQDAPANAGLKPAAPAANLPPLPSLSDLPPAGPAASRPPLPPRSGPRLVGLAGPIAGAIPLDAARGPLSIGRDAANTIALGDDTTASRQHARIENRAGGAEWVLVDAGSRNGTFVNGARVETEQPLRPGDEIAVGAARFRFEA